MKRNVVMWTVAIVCGLMAAAGAYWIILSQSAQEVQATSGAEPQPLILAAADLVPGTVLAEKHLAENTAQEIPPGAFTQRANVLGRTVREPIPQETPILESALVPAGRQVFLKESLPPGYRAIGVSVDTRGVLQQHVQPGDEVDVIVTMKDDQQIPSSKVLLQNVRVLASPEMKTPEGSRAAPREEVPVILAVTPWDAEKLALALQVGTLQLLLRGPSDHRIVQTSGVTLDTLLPTQEGGAAKGMETTYRPVEIIKGQQRQYERFREQVTDLEEDP